MNCGLRTLKREAKSALMFVSDGGVPFTVTGLAKLIARAGDGLEPARVPRPSIWVGVGPVPSGRICPRADRPTMTRRSGVTVEAHKLKVCARPMLAPMRNHGA